MVIKSLKIFTGLGVFIVLAWVIATIRVPRAPTAQPCTQEWFSYLDKNYFDISDGEGHGPDVGSGEWLGAVEVKSGLPRQSLLPMQQRCELIQSRLESRTYIVNRDRRWATSF